MRFEFFQKTPMFMLHEQLEKMNIKISLKKALTQLQNPTYSQQTP